MCDGNTVSIELATRQRICITHACAKPAVNAKRDELESENENDDEMRRIRRRTIIESPLSSNLFVTEIDVSTHSTE